MISSICVFILHPPRGMVISLLPVVVMPLKSDGGDSVVGLSGGFVALMSIHSHRKLRTP